MNITTQQYIKMGLVISVLATFISACAGQQSVSNMANKPTVTPIVNEDLTTMKWQLVSVAQSGKPAKTSLNTGVAANRFMFEFKNGRVTVRGGCNTLAGAYQLAQGNQIALGPMMSTKMACAARPLMNSDNEILSYISGITDYSINGRALTLTTAFKQRLVFKGTPTAAAQYGSEGVRKFIEIINTNQGLQWREAKYNSNWIRIKDNARWETVYPGIQGFVPETNRKYIVRIFEYINPQTQQAVWVKDMVTMNGILR